jgi:hypothetical protein
VVEEFVLGSGVEVFGEVFDDKGLLWNFFEFVVGVGDDFHELAHVVDVEPETGCVLRFFEKVFGEFLKFNQKASLEFSDDEGKVLSIDFLDPVFEGGSVAWTGVDEVEDFEHEESVFGVGP